MEDRLLSVENRHGKMETSIEELQRQREEDRALLTQMRDDLKAVKEIVTTWNNIKGFVQTVKALNSTLWFLTKTIAIIAAIAGAVYMFGKTGHWIWPVDRNGQ